MDDEGKRLEQRLDQIGATLRELAQTSVKLESRIAIIHQELQRSATQQHRLGINQESAKLAASRHETELKSLKGGIEALREVVEKIDP